ncbi:nucleoid-associated protein YgaU [Pararhizobium capsulatum DSM 1112]|uniref:Nucleoid-associated protein YgaU n=1 Tax=Pararhizobium capsulatum DSM 1112 TaxID=1121113 RepID=A0ABU0BJ29_9HYPH|nr:peptidoglycan-binding protein LysM [Pararhizobium capsulatum]MDQ0318256.1 nucleoid-associated protein YgaU [Pararhizobium capsulatum DSM 1112]
MGLFSFIKNAGKKLGIGGEDDAPDAEAVKKELSSHDLGTEKVDVSVVNDKIVLSGVVKDQSVFEKAVVAVGNTLGVSQVEASDLKVAEAGSEPAPAKTPVLYTVKKGDNLWKIAESQYGKGKGAKNTAIFDANRPMLSHPDKIYPGQVLRIPDLSEV